MRPGRCHLAAVAIMFAAGPAHAETLRVTIVQLAYSPAAVSAKVGDTIEWVNKDVVAHTATAPGEWDVMIAAGKTARLVLKKPGDVAYYCRFHPNMKGKIAVAP